MLFLYYLELVLLQPLGAVDQLESDLDSLHQEVQIRVLREVFGIQEGRIPGTAGLQPHLTPGPRPQEDGQDRHSVHVLVAEVFIDLLYIEMNV
jgi:hypothetical protein